MLPRVLKHKTALTLVELMVVLVVVAILGRASSALLVHFTQNSVFQANHLNTDMIAHDIMERILDGDTQAEGLRTSLQITSIADNDITYVDEDSNSVRFRLDTGTDILYRSINAGAEEKVPYYLPSGITIQGTSDVMFTYYDSAEAVTAVAANVRLIRISIIARMGTGSFDNLEGESDLKTAVRVNKFQ